MVTGTGYDCAPGGQYEHLHSGLCTMALLVPPPHASFWREHVHVPILPAIQQVIGKVLVCLPGYWLSSLGAGGTPWWWKSVETCRSCHWDLERTSSAVSEGFCYHMTVGPLECALWLLTDVSLGRMECTKWNCHLTLRFITLYDWKRIVRTPDLYILLPDPP